GHVLKPRGRRPGRSRVAWAGRRAPGPPAAGPRRAGPPERRTRRPPPRRASRAGRGGPDVAPGGRLRPGGASPLVWESRGDRRRRVPPSRLGPHTGGRVRLPRGPGRRGPGGRGTAADRGSTRALVPAGDPAGGRAAVA